MIALDYMTMIAPEYMTTLSSATEEGNQEESLIESDVTSSLPLGGLRLSKGGVLEFYLRACSNPEFINKFQDDVTNPYHLPQSYHFPRFEANPHLNDTDNPCLRRFEAAVKGLHDGSLLQLVFHGTPSHNIEPILQQGLDRNKRYRQAYGPGEYFSEDPLVSLSYCNGTTADGLRIQILVCVVVLPDKAAGRHTVIENSHHHIPIGTLSWVLVSGGTRWLVPTDRQTQMMALRYQNFRKRLLKEGHSEEEKRRRVQQLILLDLKNKKFAMASDLYQKFSGNLVGATERNVILQAVQEAARKGYIPKKCIATKFPGILEGRDMSTGEWELG